MRALFPVLLLTLMIPSTPGKAAEWDMGELDLGPGFDVWHRIYGQSFGDFSGSGDPKADPMGVREGVEKEDVEVEPGAPASLASFWNWPRNKLLLETSSLPLAFEVQSDPYEPGNIATWPRAKVVQRNFEIGACRLRILSGPWTVSRWERRGGQLVPVDAAIPTASRLYAAQGDTLFVQLGAELVVELHEGTTASCRERLEGQTLAIGHFHLNGTKVYAGKTRLRQKTVADSRQIYLFWREGEDHPALFGRDGPHPLLSSPVFAYRAQKRGVFPVRFVPSLGYVRGAPPARRLGAAGGSH